MMRFKFERDRTISEYSNEELMAVIDIHKQVEYLERAESNEVNGDPAMEAAEAIHGTKDGRG